MGTAAVILLAKKRGLIPLASPGIQALQDAGLWLSDGLINLLQQQAGESE
jgi:predicted nucleic acid-binding protein